MKYLENESGGVKRLLLGILMVLFINGCEEPYFGGRAEEEAVDDECIISCEVEELILMCGQGRVIEVTLEGGKEGDNFGFIYITERNETGAGEKIFDNYGGADMQYIFGLNEGEAFLRVKHKMARDDFVLRVVVEGIS